MGRKVTAETDEPLSKEWGISDMALLVTLVVVALVPPAFMELIVGEPPPVFAYWVYGVGWVAGLSPLVFRRFDAAKVTVCLCFLLVLLALWGVPWSSRKPFLQHLNRVHVGMTIAEVEQIMGGYYKWNGGDWLPPARAAKIAGKTKGPLEVIYGHSLDGAFNADFGEVRFMDGEVVSVRFLPD